MSVFTKYLTAYNKPYSSLPASLVADVKLKLKEKKTENPLVTVVVIAHNEEERIFSCLWSLAENTYDMPVEILVVNNNSTDKTAEILDDLGVTWYEEKQKGPGFARQCGLDRARGKYVFSTDSDTMYPPSYIATHMKKLIRPDVSCTYSTYSFDTAESGSSRIGMFFYITFRNLYYRIQSIKRPELIVRGSTSAYKTEYGKEVGYRTHILRGEDGALANGLKQYGKLVFISSRKARAMTSSNAISQDGSLGNVFKVRAIKALKRFRQFFTSQEEYKDQDSNIIK